LTVNFHLSTRPQWFVVGRAEPSSTSLRLLKRKLESERRRETRRDQSRKASAGDKPQKVEEEDVPAAGKGTVSGGKTRKDQWGSVQVTSERVRAMCWLTHGSLA